VALPGLFPPLLSDAFTLSSARRCVANSLPVEAMLVIFGGDAYTDIVRDQKDNSYQIITSIGDFE
jgi:hypothetical protein